MAHTTVRSRFRTEGVPEDLLIFQARMADCGVRVRLPAARPTFDLPEPLPLRGQSLAETVVHLRSPAE